MTRYLRDISPIMQEPIIIATISNKDFINMKNDIKSFEKYRARVRKPRPDGLNNCVIQYDLLPGDHKAGLIIIKVNSTNFDLIGKATKRAEKSRQIGRERKGCKGRIDPYKLKMIKILMPSEDPMEFIVPYLESRW